MFNQSFHNIGICKESTSLPNLASLVLSVRLFSLKILYYKELPQQMKTYFLELPDRNFIILYSPIGNLALRQILSLRNYILLPSLEHISKRLPLQCSD